MSCEPVAPVRDWKLLRPLRQSALSGLVRVLPAWTLVHSVTSCDGSSRRLFRESQARSSASMSASGSTSPMLFVEEDEVELVAFSCGVFKLRVLEVRYERQPPTPSKSRLSSPLMGRL